MFTFSENSLGELMVTVSPEVADALFRNNNIGYKSALKPGITTSALTLYHDKLGKCGWYDQVLFIHKTRNPVPFLCKDADVTAPETISFYFMHKLSEAYKSCKTEIDTLRQERPVLVYSVVEYLEAKKPDLMVRGGYIGAFHECSIQHSFFGPYLEIEVKVITCVENGRYLDGIVKLKCGLSGLLMNTAELPVTEATEEEITRYKEKGKAYLEITKQASYMEYSGVGSRSNYWQTKKFKCVGRVMVDVSSMKKSDPDYAMYFGIDRYTEIENDKLLPTIPEESLHRVAPVVYGYSMNAKQWVEMDLDKLSEIRFNDSAFDSLVLDDGVKDVVRSIVDSDLVNFQDIIQHKGLGYIFLLSGGPGVGE